MGIRVQPLASERGWLFQGVWQSNPALPPAWPWSSPLSGPQWLHMQMGAISPASQGCDEAPMSLVNCKVGGGRTLFTVTAGGSSSNQEGPGLVRGQSSGPGPLGPGNGPHGSMQLGPSA